MANTFEDISNDINCKYLNIHWVDSNPECSVCLQLCLQPIQLPCSHIFCFLCAKGFISRSNNCALCRRPVEFNYLSDPIVVKIKEKAADDLEGFQWFYEGRNGWWKYDERASSTLDEFFKMQEQSCELIIAGFTYVVDFEKMIQYRKNNRSRFRCIKRDVSCAERKGVAGLKLTSVITEDCMNCGEMFNEDDI